MFVIRHYEHPSTTFCELGSTQVTLNKKSYWAFSPRKDNEVNRVFHYMEPMTNLFFHNIENNIAYLQRSSPLRASPLFRIDTDTLIKTLKGHFLEQVPAPGSATAPSHGPWGEAEVALDKASIEKVSRIFSSYFQKPQHMFSVSADLDTFHDYVNHAVVDLYQEVYDTFKFAKTEIPSSFSPDTLKEFAVPQGIKLRDPRKMPCYSFAYMQAKEKRAATIIFEESKSNDPLANIFTQLKKWKYQCVDWPMAGDLVVYLTKDKIPTHVGVYQKSGKVLSKLGIQQPTTQEHELFHVPIEHYGHQVIFFRKPTGND